MAPTAFARARILSVLACCVALASCASAPPETFDLRAAPAPRVATLHAPLAIREPVASLDLDSQRILVRTGPGTLATMAGAQWADRLPALVQAKLVQTFQNANQLRFIGRSGAGFAADYVMELDIRAFELDVKKSEATIDIAVKILNARSGRVVAAQIFTAAAPAAGAGAAAAASALDAALSMLMPRIVTFASAHV